MDRGRLLVILIAAALGLASVLLLPEPAKIRGEIVHQIERFIVVTALSWLILSLALFLWRKRRA